MTLPVGQHRDQQVGPAQQRRIGGRDAAERDVVTAAGAAVGAVDVERLGGQPGQPGLVVERVAVARAARRTSPSGATLTSITPGSGVTDIEVIRGSDGGP